MTNILVLTDDDVFVCENGSDIDLKFYIADLREQLNAAIAACEALVNHRTMDEYIDAFNQARSVTQKLERHQ